MGLAAGSYVCHGIWTRVEDHSSLEARVRLSVRKRSWGNTTVVTYWNIEARFGVWPGSVVALGCGQWHCPSIPFNAGVMKVVIRRVLRKVNDYGT